MTTPNTNQPDNTFASFGQTFRNLTLHSDGRWTLQWRDDAGRKHLITAKTPQQALDKLTDKIKQFNDGGE